MTPPQLDLARRRLWLGITNVGFWVLLSAVGLYCMVTGETSGMGIGLSLCRSIVEAHAGRIASRPCASGAEIVFTLPRDHGGPNANA